MTVSTPRITARHAAWPAALGAVLAGSGAAAFGEPVALVLGLNLYVLLIAVALTAAGPERRRDFGAANRITLLRGALTAILAGAAVAGPLLDARGLWLAAGCAGLALALDGLDGWLARRTGRADAFGARFDMEIDALLMLILSLLLWTSAVAGAWVLIAGLLRYAFALAGSQWSWIARPLPPSRRRRAVCAVAVGLLAAAPIPVLPPAVAGAFAAIATTLLAASFAADLGWLVRAARQD